MVVSLCETLMPKLMTVCLFLEGIWREFMMGS